MKKITDLLVPTREQEAYFASDLPPLSATTDARSNFNQEFIYQNMLEEIKQYQFFNLNYNNLLYGKIDKSNNIVIPNTSYLEEVEFLKEQHFLLPFVKDAFENFTRQWSRLERKGALNPDTPIDIVPKKTYEHYQTLYSSFMNQHYENFLSFAKTGKAQKQITDLKSFIHVFSQYVNRVTPENPVSLTNFVSSKYCSQHVSGLFIDTMNNSSNDYGKKIKNYLQNSNFPVYVELAILHGFIIDKNLPWRLIVNLESEKTKAYIKKYTDLSDPFKFFFQKTETVDLILLKKHVLKFYNNFVNQFPTITIKETKICNTNVKVKQNQIKRNVLTEFDVNENLTKTSNEWWRLYAFIRAKESNIRISQAEFDKIAKLSFEYREKLDNERAISYLTKQIKMHPASKRKADTYRY